MSNYAVGDQAMFGDDRVEIAGGPVDSVYGIPVYLVRFLDGPNAGKGQTASAGRLSDVPATFAVGDRVTHPAWEGPGTVRFGPFRGMFGASVYLIERPDGKHTVWPGGELERAEDPWEFQDQRFEPDTDYVDREGDPWRFALVNGVLRGAYGDARRDIPDGTWYPIERAVRWSGPFTKQA